MASDQLPAVWRLYASGKQDEARRQLLGVWMAAVDAAAGPQAGRVAVALMRRLAPVTDDPQAFAALPERFTVYRQGPPDGYSWSLLREPLYGIAEGLRATLGRALTPEELAEFEMHEREVRKADVLALIMERGEYEVVLDRQREVSSNGEADAERDQG